MDLSVIIPCYNEAENVDKLHNELLPVMRTLVEADSIRSIELLFVDDGSRDGTLAALHGAFDGVNESWLTVRYAQHEVNQGLGAALRTGFARAQGDLIVTTDSDGTFRFEEIPQLLACLTPSVNIVTASPYHPAGGVMNVPFYRLLLSKGSSLLYRVLVSWDIHTYTSLFRAYRREVVERISFDSNGFLAGTELLVKALLSGDGAAEYPTVLHSRQHGVSKIKILRTVREHLRFQGQVLLWRLKLRPLGALQDVSHTVR
jgi:dolichol-phosphate mannosyltransferase